MKVLLTFKLSPESRMEMIDKFGGLYRELREDIEGFQRGGIVTPVLLQALHLGHRDGLVSREGRQASASGGGLDRERRIRTHRALHVPPGGRLMKLVKLGRICLNSLRVIGRLPWSRRNFSSGGCTS